MKINFEKTSLGIELGSTRIKAILIDEKFNVIASGSYVWENEYIDGIWTYSIENIWRGIQSAYSELREEVKQKYNAELETIGSIGFSAMMHGYMVLDKQENLLVPFRTWRNNLQEKASKQLTEIFEYPIPQRWSIAHLYQAILNGESHVENIDFMTTLAGYVHYKLTGEKVLGVGEASGMFPIDLTTNSFNTKMIEKFENIDNVKKHNINLNNILSCVKVAGENAGYLTEDGAKLLDLTGTLKAGIPLCPAEGDAGTGMVATNSVAKKTGNVSAGTSVFAMVVLEKDLSKVYTEIDQVTTPAGDLVAMVHSNNCTSDLNAWVNLFREVCDTFGVNPSDDELFGKLYKKALEGDKDGGGLLAYGYLSGEHITGFEEGRPLFARKPDSNFTLANFMRTNLYTSLGALKIGLDILFDKENVKIDEMLGHGGLFKTEEVGQRIMSSAINVPVTTMSTASEGGAWGMALLGMYMLEKENDKLSEFLTDRVFNDVKTVTIKAEEDEVKGFNEFISRYKNGLEIEKMVVECL